MRFLLAVGATEGHRICQYRVTGTTVIPPTGKNSVFVVCCSTGNRFKAELTDGIILLWLTEAFCEAEVADLTTVNAETAIMRVFTSQTPS